MTIVLWIIGSIIGVLFALIAASIISYRLKWAVFVKDADLPTATLMGKHNDWIWPFKYIPRRFNAFLNGPGRHQKFPKQLLGTNKKIVMRDGVVYVPYDDKPILQQDVPGPGQWCLSWPFHFAWLTSETGYIIAFGVRKDYFDGPMGYWTLRAAFHKN